MKKLSELTDFYYKVLYPPLQKLEKQREQLRHKLLTIGLLLGVVTIVLYSFVHKASGGETQFMIFFAFGYIALGSILYKIFTKEYTQEFKTKIITPLIKEIDNSLNYQPEQYISQHIFERSKIFTSNIDRYSGNDYVHGKIDEVSLMFSDVHAEQKHKNSKGNDNWSTIFQGLFIIADFHKNFHGSTVILPDTAQKTFGEVLGGWLQSKNLSREDLVKMDNPEFEKMFVVYGTDQIEARYILSHTIMEKLIAFQKKSKHPLFVSFVNNSIHMAIEYNKDLFEPSVFHSLLDYKIAMEYISSLHFCINIVDELKLNQKLWSKQS